MRSLTDSIARLRTVRRLGARAVFLAGVHRARIRAGSYRRTAPCGSWSAEPPAYARRAQSPFAPPDLSAVRALGAESGLGQEAIACGDRIVAGKMLCFSHRWLPRPSDWRTNPETGVTTPLAHWSCIPDFDEQVGDIKYVWEASRFDWVYQLARAWAHSGDEKYVEGFWRLLEDWRDQNPPNAGANWKCGQECSLRLLALAWAGGVFEACAASTPDRKAMLWETVARLAERITISLGYAESQNNNHALSETAGLYLASTCLPEHPAAETWRRMGLGRMCRLVTEQFGRDGSYVQHSHNYTRLALRDTFFALYTARANGDTVPAEVRERLGSAARLLYQLQDAASGQVPNYGHTDGANILSLSGCLYRDYRPALQTMAYLLDGVRWYDTGPWDEELLWHFVPEALAAPVRPPSRKSVAAAEGGYYVLRDPAADAVAVARCHAYRTRPAHADSLHLDYWYRGVNVLLDAGSFSYHAAPVWHRYFVGTSSHNTVTVDERDQMIAGPRFLWLNWTRAAMMRFEPADDGGILEGQDESYITVSHNRRVSLRRGLCVILDDLRSNGSSHQFRLHWALADLPLQQLPDGGRLSLPSAQCTVRVAVRANRPITCDWGRAQESPDPRGWSSGYYGAREPVWSFACHASGPSVTFITVVGPEEDVEGVTPLLDTAPEQLWSRLTCERDL